MLPTLLCGAHAPALVLSHLDGRGGRLLTFPLHSHHSLPSSSQPLLNSCSVHQYHPAGRPTSPMIELLTAHAAVHLQRRSEHQTARQAIEEKRREDKKAVILSRLQCNGVYKNLLTKILSGYFFAETRTSGGYPTLVYSTLLNI